jgi:hypothetical protein
MKRLAVLCCVLLAGAIVGYVVMIHMPGESYRGPVPSLNEDEQRLRDALRRDVEVLAGDIGARSVLFPRQLARAADHLEAQLAESGYSPVRQCFEVEGVSCCNIEAELTGGDLAAEVVVVGGHYDSVTESGLFCPGANDNASGAAATLALARAFAGRPMRRTVRFVLFVNEEPPHFQTSTMGSAHYARRCRDRGERIVAMMSLETIGCYLDEPGSQHYPPPFGLMYPSTGNFIAFVGNVASRRLVRQAIGVFRARARIPSEGGAVPGWVPGVGWSDHWAFWREGYPAIMITDTAPFRYPHYHRESDTPDKIDYERMTLVVCGLEYVVRALAEEVRVTNR